MCMDRCSKCQELVNTDDCPEAYREEYEDACICQWCWEVIEEEEE